MNTQQQPYKRKTSDHQSLGTMVGGWDANAVWVSVSTTIALLYTNFNPLSRGLDNIEARSQGYARMAA